VSQTAQPADDWGTVDAAEQTDEQVDDPDLPLDVTFEILKNERRRHVLEYVRSADETVTIGELAEHIAAIENDTTVQQLNAQQRKRVYIGLYQCHLPKMDDAGVVEFNQSRGLVELAPAATPLYAYLDVDGDDDDAERSTSPRAYSLLVFGSGVLFVAALLANELVLSHAVLLLFLCCILVLSVRCLRA